MIEKVVPDTSVLIESILSQKITAGELAPQGVIIAEAVVAELEHQANSNKTTGFLGLDELKALKELAEEKEFSLTFAGRKPSASEIRYAKLGDIDALIRQLAFDEGATLMTADRVQARVAGIKGIAVLFIEFEKKVKKLKLESFFDNTTMSVHLKEKIKPYAKKGTPGNWKAVVLREKLLSREEVREIAREIIEEAGKQREAFVEIDRPGSTIVQFGHYRIVITRPPFSEGWEITAVRPVKKLSLEDYKLSEKLKQRVGEQAEGILIAGSPGMGKSTFAQALAEYYALQNRTVKTVEAPRDLVVPESVTQYAISHGSSQEIHDILLLSRPDNTIFDEMRNTADFKLFADLRLAGIGLAGVIHATNPIDAIQRFVGRIELGVIPQVIDTVIFIKNGAIDKVLALQMIVKVPSGMTEADLARPVVVVHDFETKTLEYELYTYGEETVVIPVKAGGKTPLQEMAAKSIEQEFMRYSPQAKVEVTSDNSCIAYVPPDVVARVIGKGGSNIEHIEERLGMHVEVRELRGKQPRKGSLEYDTKIGKKNVVFYLDKAIANQDVEIYIDEDFVMTARVSAKGAVKITKRNKMAKVLIDAVTAGENVRIALA